MVSEKQFESLVEKFGTALRITNTRSTASVLEQISISGSNMLIGFILVYAAGIEEFGVFSFCMSMTILANGIYRSLIHRQMLLHSAPESTLEQNQYFFNSLSLDLLLFPFIALIALLVSFLYFDHADQYTIITLTSVLLYLFTLNIYDLFKQFLYVRKMQIYSLRCTAYWILVKLTLILPIAYYSSASWMVPLSYLAISTGLIVSIINNKHCRLALQQSKWEGMKEVLATLNTFWKQGKFGMTGVTVTWIQNQTLNPIMMLAAGPLIAGYISLARLLVMPMAVVNQGLVNSSTADLRRIFKNHGLDKFDVSMQRFIKINFSFAAFYILFLIAMHFTRVFENTVPDYNNIRLYVLFWIVFLCISMYRFWCSQFFLVQIKMDVILKVSLIAIIVYLMGAFVSIYYLDNLNLVLAFMIAAELLSIILINKKRDTQTRTQ